MRAVSFHLSLRLTQSHRRSISHVPCMRASQYWHGWGITSWKTIRLLGRFRLNIDWRDSGQPSTPHTAQRCVTEKGELQDEINNVHRNERSQGGRASLAGEVNWHCARRGKRVKCSEPDQKGWDMTLPCSRESKTTVLIENLHARGGPAKRQLVALNVEVCVLPQLYPPARW